MLVTKAILAQSVEQIISNDQVVGSNPIDGIPSINNPEVNFKIMALGTAGKSSSGASMSKYDVEVESRLQALEAAVASLQAHSHEAPSDTGVGGDIEAAVKELQAHSHDTPAASSDADARLDEVERLMRDSGLV